MYRDCIKLGVKILSVIIVAALVIGLGTFFVYHRGKTSPDIATMSKAEPASGQAGHPNANQSLEKYQEGKHYQKLPAKITTERLIQQFTAQDPNKIQVIEFFNYACFWCQRLHPQINEWAATKPHNVILYRFPIVFNKGWEVMAKAYLIVQMLNQTDKLDAPFFQAIHQDNLNLANEQLLQEFFVKQGVEQSKFLELYGSFAVSRALQHSNDLSNAYQLTVSPAIIVNGPSGSYLVTPSLVGNDASVLDVLTWLVAREAKLAETD